MPRFWGLLILGIVCSLLSGQTNVASVDGLVTDPSANTVIGAEVRARSTETVIVNADYLKKKKTLDMRLVKVNN